MSETRQGRPSAITLDPEHADLVRKAVKASARYFGIRLQDVGGGASWVTDAMRTRRPMSVATALKLYHVAERPKSDLVANKKPKGPSMAEIWQDCLDHVKDPSIKIERNATVEYLGGMFIAARTLERYSPLPGSAFFVLPGAGRSIAESLANDLAAFGIGAQRRREIADYFAEIFRRAEEPLRTDVGEELIPRLIFLAMINNFTLLAENPEAGSDHADKILEAIEAVSSAEKQRSGGQGNAKKPAARKKRRVVMPRIKDQL